MSLGLLSSPPRVIFSSLSVGFCAPSASWEMSATRGEMKAHLSRALDSHIRSIEEILQILENSAAASLEKVEWSQVIKLGDEISKQATVAGMLCSGEKPEIKQLKENMDAYFNVLHCFVLLCHGNTVGAGPTFHASICASARQVVNSSLALLREVVSIESQSSSKRPPVIPQLSGCVWDACSNLKKTPTSNCTAVGRAITHVAVSVKDIVREMNELKPAASTASAGSSSVEKDDYADEEFGEDLSPEEMFIARLATRAISDVLVALKEVSRFVYGLHEPSNNENMERVDALERLLSCCREIGDRANDLGASVYPPQEISALKSAARRICAVVADIQKEVEVIAGPHHSCLACFEGLESSLKTLESCVGDDVICKMEKLTL